MRAVALLAVRNEEYYLERCLEHLCEQGVETCLIDNGSTDRTLKIAEAWLQKGVIRIDQYPFNGTLELEKLLKFKEHLSKEIDADWFIHHDADEIREAPKGFGTLVDGIKKVDVEGYNAINSDELVFVPTSENESFEGRDYVDRMQYYYYFKPKELHRVNIWKNTGVPIDLASSGGHSVNFPGRQTYPKNFILRHYLMLSKRHAMEKYGKRKYSSEGLKKGWHRKRAELKVENIKLPNKKILKKVPGNKEWDLSDPWKEHFF
jgi:glycosyltransferase involved in cell wall biosynthesis